MYGLVVNGNGVVETTAGMKAAGNTGEKAKRGNRDIGKMVTKGTAGIKGAGTSAYG